MPLLPLPLPRLTPPSSGSAQPWPELPNPPTRRCPAHLFLWPGSLAAPPPAPRGRQLGAFPSLLHPQGLAVRPPPPESCGMVTAMFQKFTLVWKNPKCQRILLMLSFPTKSRLLHCKLLPPTERRRMDAPGRGMARPGDWDSHPSGLQTQ